MHVDPNSVLFTVLNAVFASWVVQFLLDRGPFLQLYAVAFATDALCCRPIWFGAEAGTVLGLFVLSVLVPDPAGVLASLYFFACVLAGPALLWILTASSQWDAYLSVRVRASSSPLWQLVLAGVMVLYACVFPYKWYIHAGMVAAVCALAFVCVEAVRFWWVECVFPMAAALTPAVNTTVLLAAAAMCLWLVQRPLALHLLYAAGALVLIGMTAGEDWELEVLWLLCVGALLVGEFIISSRVSCVGMAVLHLGCGVIMGYVLSSTSSPAQKLFLWARIFVLVLVGTACMWRVIGAGVTATAHCFVWLMRLYPGV